MRDRERERKTRMRENIDCTQVIRWKSQSVDGWMDGGCERMQHHSRQRESDRERKKQL